MPTIIIIDGIIIQIHPKQKEHNPPHVHARYGDFEASFNIKTGDCIDGSFPPKQAKIVTQYIKGHSKELLEAWEKH